MDQPLQEAVQAQDNREQQEGEKSPVEKLMERLEENQKIIEDVQQQVLLQLQEAEFFNGTHSPFKQSEHTPEDIYIKTDETLEEENEILWTELEDLLRERKQFGLFLKQQVALWETRLSSLQSCDEAELRKNLELFVAMDKKEFTEVMKHQCQQFKHAWEEEEEEERREEENRKDQPTEETD